MDSRQRIGSVYLRGLTIWRDQNAKTTSSRSVWGLSGQGVGKVPCCSIAERQRTSTLQADARVSIRDISCKCSLCILKGLYRTGNDSPTGDHQQAHVQSCLGLRADGTSLYSQTRCEGIDLGCRLAALRCCSVAVSAVSVPRSAGWMYFASSKRQASFVYCA